jgi:predicted patatin/cPLA2 family phospholipase
MINGRFTHRPIQGRLPKTMLPKGCALVLEGGGMRGFYSAGVFEAFMEAGIMFPYIAAVSAAAANGLSYVTGQPGRNREVVEHYAGLKRYVSKRNMLLHGAMFNMDFVFREVPQKHVGFDWDIFNELDIRYLTGVMSCETGKTIWFEKDAITPQLEITAASCSLPLLAPIVRHNGMELLDGGVSDPIPIEKSIADGNKFHVIVLTRNEGYIKPEFDYKLLLKLVYRKYPNVVNTVLERPKIYNRQLKLCEQLEKEGKAIIIRPLKPLEIERTVNDTQKLLALYDEGHEEGRSKMAEILRRCASSPPTS